LLIACGLIIVWGAVSGLLLIRLGACWGAPTVLACMPPEGGGGDVITAGACHL
jgi:hypothetical protein